MDQPALDNLLQFCARQAKELTSRDARSGELKLSKNGVYLIERDGAMAALHHVPWDRLLDQTSK